MVSAADRGALMRRLSGKNSAARLAAWNVSESIGREPGWQKVITNVVCDAGTLGFNSVAKILALMSIRPMPPSARSFAGKCARP